MDVLYEVLVGIVLAVKCVGIIKDSLRGSPINLLGCRMLTDERDVIPKVPLVDAVFEGGLELGELARVPSLIGLLEGVEAGSSFL